MCMCMEVQGQLMHKHVFQLWFVTVTPLTHCFLLDFKMWLLIIKKVPHHDALDNPALNLSKLSK